MKSLKTLLFQYYQSIQHSFKIKKKMTAPGLAHRKRSGETNPFEVNVSTTIEHYITWGLALPYPFSKKDR